MCHTTNVVAATPSYIDPRRETPPPARTARLRDETPLRTQEHNDIYVAFLEFFMDLKLNYDVSYETDKIGPTTNPLTDIEDELTREKLPFLYDVAMTMRDGAKPEVQLGIWRLVVDKLIDRTGMSNKEFSVWASRILAEGGSACLLCTSPSPRDATLSRMPSSA